MGNKKRKYADDGWALWIDGDDRSSIYFNEWIDPRGKNYVDVSVRVYGARETRSINFFVPFGITAEEITDLSYMLSDEAALRSLFNTNGRIDTEKSKYTSELHYDGRTVSLINLAGEFVAIKPVSHGTVITVDVDFLKEYMTADEAYLIFRLPHKTLDKIFVPSLNVNSIADRMKSLIQTPIISEKYGYSLRVNEARLLPDEINEIETLQQQRIRKALVTISIDSEYEMNDSNCTRIRRLEAELNRNYAPQGYDCTEAITYQWVEERDSSLKAHYNFYFIMQHNSISKLSMLLYLFIILLCGALGSALYDLIKIIIGMF